MLSAILQLLFQKENSISNHISLKYRTKRLKLLSFFRFPTSRQGTLGQLILKIKKLHSILAYKDYKFSQ